MNLVKQARRIAIKAAKDKTPKLSGGYFKLLTPGNPKTIKGMKRGYMTFILHFAPGNLSGYQVCPSATAACLAACLNTAGRGGIAKGGNLTLATLLEGRRTNHIQDARVRRTKLFFEHRPLFMAYLICDIIKAIEYCVAWDLIPVFRLNGTSDIRWELAHFEGRKLIAEIFPTIQFYDYTKIPNRKNIPSNYHITFSLSEDNDSQARAMLARGINVAAVFRNKRTVAHYEATGFLGSPVHNGDDSDLRFLDPVGVTALYAKGNARGDTTGFVRDMPLAA